MFGIRNNQWRTVALMLFVCAVAALAAAGSTQGAESRPTVTYANGSLMFNGRPFVPFLGAVLDTCPARDVVDVLVELKVDVIRGLNKVCPGSGITPEKHVELLHQALTGRASGPVWWLEQDEGTQQTLSALPEMLDWQANPSFVHAGFLMSCNSTSSLGTYNSVKAKSSGPVIARVQIGSPLDGDPRACVTPAKVRAETYTALAAGADGIEWSTANPLNAGQNPSVTRQNATAARALATELTGFESILAQGMKVKVTSTGTVRAFARKYRGTIYIFAVNTSREGSTTKMTVTGLGTTKAITVKGGVTRNSTRGVINDNFAPLAVHIFKTAPRP